MVRGWTDRQSLRLRGHDWAPSPDPGDAMDSRGVHHHIQLHLRLRLDWLLLVIWAGGGLDSTVNTPENVPVHDTDDELL